MKEYPILVADPPWQYANDPMKPQAAGKHYKCMGLHELLTEVRWPLAKPGILFLWATCPKLQEAMLLGDALGLHYRGVAFVWVKTKQDGTPVGAMGVRPSIVKPLTELVLAFSNKATGRPLPLSDESIRQTCFAPVTVHSEKPAAVQDAIDRMYPTLPKYEMFARRRRPGWDAMGDQLPPE